MSEPEREGQKKSPAFQRLAIQLLEGAILVPEDEKQYSGALIKLAGVANEEFCSEFDQRMSAIFEKISKRFYGAMARQNEPEDSLLFQEDGDPDFLLENTSSLVLKHSDPKAFRKLDALMELVEGEDDDSQDTDHYFVPSPFRGKSDFRVSFQFMGLLDDGF